QHRFDPRVARGTGAEGMRVDANIFLTKMVESCCKVSRVRVSVGQKDKSLDVVWRERARGVVKRGRETRLALIDGARLRLARNFHLRQIRRRVEGDGVCRESHKLRHG